VTGGRGDAACQALGRRLVRIPRQTVGRCAFRQADRRRSRPQRTLAATVRRREQRPTRGMRTLLGQDIPRAITQALAVFKLA